MNKIFFKFALAFALLLNTVIFVLFFEDLIYYVEDYLFPLFFIYFIFDSFGVILPMFNDAVYSSKMQKKMFIEVPSYNEEKLKEKAKINNYKAIFIFFIYFGSIALIGTAYLHFSWFDSKFIYLIFFALNFADYFCIMLWCPFRHLILKNSCCNTCRISNWDRIMKFSILIFVPNIYTITIFIIGVLIFLYWEFQHFVHPERFYRMSNQTLWCTNCDKITCGKNNKKE